MPQGFTASPYRLDPYKNFKFTIEIDGKTVFGVSKVGAIKRTTEVVKHRDGGAASSDIKSPGRTSYEAIHLERGVTHDPDFEQWANTVHPYRDDPRMDLKNYKKELTLVLRNERGVPVKRYFLHGCWVSEYTGLPDLDANANAVAIESMKIELDGWERDPDTREPDQNAAVPKQG